MRYLGVSTQPCQHLEGRWQPCRCRQAISGWNSSFSLPTWVRLEGKRFLELSKEDELHPELESLDGDLDPGLPSTEDVILKTEQVTKNIQELLRAAQEFKHDR